MLKRLVKLVSMRARARRAEIFRKNLNPTDQDRILDLGAGDGSHIARVIPYRANVYIADINLECLARGRDRYGVKPVLLGESGQLPFADNSFDIVFCSSVIEHVTARKADIGRFRTNREFSEVAFKRQHEFANEIRRVGKRYFVQTPNKYFPIESHTWLPFIFVFLPRAWQVGLIHFMNRWWPKTTSPDWHLLSSRQMQELFPDAEIVLEKILGLTKSIMAVKIDEPST